MGVNFSAFEIGRRALRASQLGINITGQNIANVNTPGYTRLRVEVVPTATNGAQLRLSGSEISLEGVHALRDQFVEARLQTETGLTGRLEARRDALTPVDAIFNDGAGGGALQSALVGFFGSFRDLEAQPTSVAARASVAAQADNLASTFRTTRGRLTEVRADIDTTVRISVDQVNTLSEQVAQFNAKIGLAESSGDLATELRDQRGEVVRQLAEMTGARTAQDVSGQITLALPDGRALVVADQAFALKVTSVPPNGLASLELAGEPVTLTSGKLKGLQEALEEITGQVTSLDELATSVADRVNTLHAAGSDLNGNNGMDLFTAIGGGALTAETMQLDAAFTANPRLIVAAANGAGSGDASIARSLGGLLSDQSSVVGTQTGSYENFYASLVTSAGTSVRSAEDALATQQLILAQTQAQRDSISGVSLDEEAINLLQYQKAYEAAARFLKVADEMTQTILSLAQ
jgi:flagellar hook-associated protein 1 FlgK